MINYVPVEKRIQALKRKTNESLIREVRKHWSEPDPYNSAGEYSRALALELAARLAECEKCLDTFL